MLDGDSQCPLPSVDFTTDNVKRVIKTFDNKNDADKWLLSQKKDAEIKSSEIKKTNSLIKKFLRNTLCKMNKHDIDVYANNGVCLNCGKVIPLKNVEWEVIKNKYENI